MTSYTGTKGNDTFGGDGKNDQLYGLAGNDSLYGFGGDDTIYGGSGSDKLYGGDGHDVLFGGVSGDALYGNDGSDTLSGDDGNDTLDGGAGVDLLIGGKGADYLYGGAGADYFVYLSTNDDYGGHDTIKDFSQAQGDKLDISAIDANTKVDGNQAFHFIGDGAFTGHAGEARFYDVNGAVDKGVMVALDTNGDKTADLTFLLEDIHPTLHVSDFIL